ncbi:NAD(P)/FAD-dependent oxidoreductase [Aquihabitans sp. McL0605]|uniref:NAD(P)/FAD-dependent oxidoreductase n=1 Tax=Aquihabitans sp. McL0605 TaxID=3415671 RepID=UPI003CE771A1
MDATEPATSTPSSTDRFDVAIVGGSMAGLTAALVLGRARRRVVVIDAGHPMNEGVAHSQGFPTRDGVAPTELVALLRDEVAVYGVTVIDGRVGAVARNDEGFTVAVDGHEDLVARRVVLATGGRVDLPDLPGLAEVWGGDAANCPYCHGWELQDRRLALIGDQTKVPMMARILTQWSDDIVAFAGAATDMAAAEQAGIEVERRVPVRIVQTGGRLQGIEVDDGTVVPCGGLFVVGLPVAGSSLAVGLGAALDEHGFVAADREGVTSVPGVYAIGSAVDPTHQLTGAADSGTRAARWLNHDLIEEDLAAR